MKLLIVRHAIAEESASGGDAARRLTKEGRAKMAKGARALADLVPELALVLSSPLVRARETAEIVVAAFPDRSSKRLPLAEVEALGPGGRASDVVLALVAQKRLAAIAVVGHEPNLSRLEGYLLTGQERSLAELKKGGAALVEIDGVVAPGAGSLLWHLTPAQLRALAP